MLTTGLLLAAGGLIATIYAAAERSTGTYTLAAAFGMEEAAKLDNVLYIGIGALALGAVLLISYFVNKNNGE